MQGPDTTPKLSDELLRRMAEELVGLPMSDEHRGELLPVLDGLLAEVRRVSLQSRSGSEPAVAFELGDWKS